MENLVKYNKSYEGIDFEEYLKYLLKIKNDISVELYDFISDPERHNFSEKSLHDSFIENIEIKNNLKNKKADIIINLLGDNRRFILHCIATSQYKIIQDTHDGYKDLITYEIGIERDNKNKEGMVFRALFGFDYGEIEIYCKEIKIEEKII
jgi:hypothetical protein